MTKLSPRRPFSPVRLARALLRSTSSTGAAITMCRGDIGRLSPETSEPERSAWNETLRILEARANDLGVAPS